MKRLIIIFIGLVSMAHSLYASSLTDKNKECENGMIYFACDGYVNVEEVLENPYIIAGLYTIYWNDAEPQKGKFNWEEADQFINRWTKAGKKVALRIMWSSSGYWKHKSAATPAPGWLWKEGAKYAYHEGSKTQIPLFWDPIVKKNAIEFMKEINAHFGKNKNILFIDITPGAETNPYRFGTINRRDPGFKEIFKQTPASDGRTYSDQLWTETVVEWINNTAKTITDIPCLVTLNLGSLMGCNNFPIFGQTAVNNGMYVGQNGIAEHSYRQGNDNFRTMLFKEWSKKTKLFFEMVHAAETSNTGTMQGVVDAAQRIGCNYLNVYPQDVMKATKKSKLYTPKWEDALKNGYEYFSKQNDQ